MLPHLKMMRVLALVITHSGRIGASKGAKKGLWVGPLALVTIRFYLLLTSLITVGFLADATHEYFGLPSIIHSFLKMKATLFTVC